jgi:hypothetical protein
MSDFDQSGTLKAAEEFQATIRRCFTQWVARAGADIDADELWKFMA